MSTIEEHKCAENSYGLQQNILLNFWPKFVTEHSNQYFSQFIHPNWFKLFQIAYIYGLELLECFQFFLKILNFWSNFGQKFLSPNVAT